MGSNKKNSGNHDERLLRLNSEKLTIERRRKNLGKSITDNLPTVEVDPETLDLYSTVDPLPVVMDAIFAVCQASMMEAIAACRCTGAVRTMRI